MEGVFVGNTDSPDCHGIFQFLRGELAGWIVLEILLGISVVSLLIDRVNSLYRIAFVFAPLIAFPNTFRGEDLIFETDSEWEVVSTGHRFAEGMAWDSEGNFYFTDVPRSLLFKVEADSGEKVLLDDNTGRANGIAFGPDGRLYGCARGANCIYAWDTATWEKVAVARGEASNDIAILDDGTVFFTDPATHSIWRIDSSSGSLVKAMDTEWMPNGLSLSLDQNTLLVAEFNSGNIHGVMVRDQGTLDAPGEVTYRVGIPSTGLGRLDGMQPLRDGRLLIGTALGIQVAPRAGEEGSSPLVVVPSPEGRPRCNYARISPDGVWLYVAFAQDLLRRKIVKGFGQ